jgi:hypothetical protein
MSDWYVASIIVWSFLAFVGVVAAVEKYDKQETIQFKLGMYVLGAAVIACTAIVWPLLLGILLFGLSGLLIRKIVRKFI